jgi:hypothetical protein
MDDISNIDKKELDDLFKKLSEAIKIIEQNGDATHYVPWAKEWFNKNAPQYLE